MPTAIPTLASFTPGDLVVSISGDGDGSGTYGDNQASPITLEEISITGSIVGQLVLPQTTTVVNGVTEYAVSGEYGSSSEGSLQLSADGQSLVIMGYGVDAATFNAGGVAVYGNAALAQSTSVPGGQYTTVSRVIADISFNGSIDTSTALYNVANTNNPRSAATINGSTFYVSGQGVKGDTTQGVFLAHDGANGAIPIDTSTDTRTAEIINGQLYVSRDSTQGIGGSDNIANYGSALPTSATAPVPLAGIDGTVTLTVAQANGVNSADIGQIVHLSPENFFFADANTLYVTDGGDPKEGGLGDGGLQKWVFNGTTWKLEYTLSAGLNLVPDTATSGTTGLIGLTGTVVGGVAYLYATNSTLGDLDQTYVYGIADTVASTTGAGETFAALVTAAADSNIRGISLAPTQSATTPATTSVTSGSTQSGVVVTSGGALDILSGGTAVSATILSGGTAVVSSGGLDIGASIDHDANETVLGSASGDFVGGVQLVSAATAVVSNETILNGGSVELFLKGAISNSLTVETGGVLAISGNATASSTVIDGGTLMMESAKAVLAGSLDFIAAGTIEVTAVSSAGYGDLAVISGFNVGDAIDFTTIGAGATLSATASGGNTVATVTSGGIAQSFTLAGAFGSTLQLVSDGGAGEEITFSAPPPVSTMVGAGSSQSGILVTSGSVLDVQSGGTAVAATIMSGGAGTIELGGLDSGSVISAGGNELVLGSVTGDSVYGTQLISGGSAVVSNETVYAGGNVDLFLKGGVVANLTIENGGSFNINGAATGSNTVLSGGVIDLQSPKATLTGSLTFAGAATLEYTDVSSAGFGDLAVISGFAAGDAVDFTLIGSGAVLSTTLSGGNTFATVTSGGVTQSALFAGDMTTDLTLVGDGAGGEEIVVGSGTTSSSSSSATSVTSGSTQSGLVVGGGTELDVLSGGTIVGASVLSGGSAVVEVGGFDAGSTIAAGGSETVAGFATLDQIVGTQMVGGSVSSETISAGGSVVVPAGGIDSGSTIAAGGNENVLGSASGDVIAGIQVLASAASAVVSNESVVNGGSVELFLAGVIGNGLTVETGGVLAINGRGTAEATVLNGGTLMLESPKATLSGTLTFSGAGELQETDTVLVTSGGKYFGDQAVISGFGAGDVIDFTGATAVGAAGAATTMSITTSSGDTYATVSGGGATETFIFDGTSIGANLALQSDGAGGEEVVYSAPAAAASSWANDVSGDFADPTKWTGGVVPGATTDASIDFADDPQVTHLTGNDSVHSLSNVAGNFLMEDGTLTTGALTNDALMGWTGGSFVLNAGAGSATLTNATGGILTIGANGQSLTATGWASLVNAGSILVSGGAGTAAIDVALDNTGAVMVGQGTLSLNGGGNSDGAGLRSSVGGVLQFGGGDFTVSGGEYQVLNTTISGGTLDVSGASSVFFVSSLQLMGGGTLLLGAQNATAQNSFAQGPGTGGTPFLSGSGTLTVYGGGTLTSGVESGFGLTRLIGTNLLGGGISVDGGRTVENDGWMNWSSGEIVLGAGDAGAATQAGTITNAANATFYVTADDRMSNSGAGTSVFDNAGVTAVYAGSGETDIDATVVNAGYIQVQGGTLSLNGGGSSAGDRLYVASGAVLQFGMMAAGAPGGTFSITSGQYTASYTAITGGTLDVSAASGAIFVNQLQISSGLLQLGALSDGAVQGALVQTGGTLLGGGTLTVYNGAELTGGVQSGAATTRLYGNSQIGGSFALDGGRTVENDGWINWTSGTVTLGAGYSGAVTQAGTLSNVAGAVFYITASSGRIAVGTSGVVNNAGVMAVFAGTGETDIDAVLNSTGGLQVQSGTLSLNGGGTIDAGQLYVAPGAVLQFGTQPGTGMGGAFSFTNGPYIASDTVVQAGTVDLSAVSGISFGNALSVEGGTLLLGSNFATTAGLNQIGGVVSGSAYLTVTAPAQLDAGLQTGSGRTLLHDGGSIGGSVALDGGRSLENAGTLSVAGGALTLGGGDTSLTTHSALLLNDAGALLNIQGDGTIINQGSAGTGAIDNAGTLLKSAGTGTATIGVGMFNNGVVEASSGTLALDGGVSGAGTLLVDGQATLDFANIVVGNESLSFLQGGGTVQVDTTGSFGATISGFAAGDMLDASAVLSSLTPTYAFNSGSLVVSDGTHSLGFVLTGSYASNGFVLASDGHGGTAIHLS